MRPFALRHARVGIALAAAVLAGLAPAAIAAVPAPANCTVETALIGTWTGAAVSTAVTPCAPNQPELFLVVVRDAANLPIPGATVKVLLAGSGTHFHTVQDPGVINVCPGNEMAMTADASGTVRMNLRIAGSNDAPSALVVADGVPLATLPIRSPDYDGDGRVGLSDFAIFASDFLSPALPHPRSDFDNCPTTQLPDFAFFVTQYQASNNQPAAALCP